jgi:hypothetical protein
VGGTYTVGNTMQWASCRPLGNGTVEHLGRGIVRQWATSGLAVRQWAVSFYYLCSGQSGSG